MKCEQFFKGSSWRRLQFCRLWLICLIIVLSADCRKKKPANEPAPPMVEVTQVIEKDVPVYSEWVAMTDGLVNAVIRAQVQGYLIKQNYKEGEFVKQGEVLFEIDPRPFEAALNQAQAALAQAKASQNQAQAEVARSEAQLFIAQSNLARVKPLAEKKAISQKDLDDATGTERSAEAAVAAAKAAAGSAQAAIGVAQAAVEKAQLDLDFTKINSPIDGIAGIATAQVGDLVGPAQGGQLTTVSTVDPIKVYFSISEQSCISYMNQCVAPAASIEHEKTLEHELILADGSLYSQKGRFYAADREVDPRTGTLRIAVLFPNPGNLLRPGQFARIRIATETKKGALLIPQRAVTELQGSYQVAVIGEDNHAEIRTVKPGERVASLWVIDQGLKPGERVVAEGTQKVKPGALVNPQPWAQAATASQTPSARPEAKPTQGGS